MPPESIALLERLTLPGETKTQTILRALTALEMNSRPVDVSELAVRLETLEVRSGIAGSKGPPPAADRRAPVSNGDLGAWPAHAHSHNGERRVQPERRMANLSANARHNPDQ